jgi:diguanylate cyclase (GGDEF)-like protein
MKEMELRKRWKAWLFGNVPVRFFRDDEQMLQAENLVTLRLASCLALALCACVGAASFFFPVLYPARALYLILCGGNLAGVLAAFRVLPNHPLAARPVLYGYMVFWDLAALLLDTRYSPAGAAAAFFVTAFAASVLVLDHPVFPILITTAVHALFCFATAYWKAPYPKIIEKDWADSAYTLLVSILFCSFMINLRLKNLQAVQLFPTQDETDPLTGLSNKQAIDRVCRAYLRPDRTNGCALILLDIDNFHQINEMQGRAVGDEVLHSVGLTMRAMFREDDVIGRFGGDEFLILMKNISNVEDVRLKAERLHGRMADIVACGRPLACSMGVAVAAPSDGVAFERLFSCADMALYGSKENGKDTVTLYRPESSEAAPAATV